MTDSRENINVLHTFMQSEVYASLDSVTRANLAKKRAELCGSYFLKIAAKLNRNKVQGCFAPHKAVMIIAIMELVESGHIADNVVCLDRELKDKFKEVWTRLVPAGSPFKCGYRNPFLYMDSEPFWNLSGHSDRAYITWESFFAFSHAESRQAIREFLQRTIADDTISPQYRNNHPSIDWMVAEDILGVIPFLYLFASV